MFVKAVSYRIFFFYPEMRQNRGLLKVGRCTESEIGPFSTPT